MAKVGRFVMDPKAGAYCQIDLEDGKKVLVNHEKGGPQGGRITVAEKRLWGGETFLDLRLESAEGQAALTRPPRSARSSRRSEAAPRWRTCARAARPSAPPPDFSRCVTVTAPSVLGSRTKAPGRSPARGSTNPAIYRLRALACPLLLCRRDRCAQRNTGDPETLNNAVGGGRAWPI
jgi:hypothetical protein